jgi:hypothetical protein
MWLSSPRWLFDVDCKKRDAVRNNTPILKHPGAKENGKNVRIKAIWHAGRVVIDSHEQKKPIHVP